MIIIRIIYRIINWIRLFLFNRLVKMRSKLRMSSLREAIGKADDNKAFSGRKTMVVYNNHSGSYEAIEKRVLKKVQARDKIKGQPKETDFRKNRRRKPKPARFTHDRIKTLEKKSLYVA